MPRVRRDRDEHNEQGFTLVELLVVVVILGILIAIAIPLYLNYRKSANDKAAQSDLRNVVSVLELCLSDNKVYPVAATFTPASNTVCASRNTGVSAGTTIAYYLSTTDPTGFIVGSSNTGGTGRSYCYQSRQAGQVTTTTTPVTGYRDAC